MNGFSLQEWGSPRGFREQGNIGKISKGTREHERIFSEQGKKIYKLEDENIATKFIKRGTNKENVWEHGNIGQFWKGTRKQWAPRETLKNANIGQELLIF